jgi:hypothetical protein
MQLGSVRSQLRNATCCLLGCVTLGNQAEALPAKDTKSSIEFASLVYYELDRVRVIQPALRYTRKLQGERLLKINLGFDTMSGASPNGAATTGIAQSFTSPSGEDVDVSAGKLPTWEFRDLRNSAGIEWENPLGRLSKIALGGNFSKEADYQSAGLSASYSQDLFQRRTTITSGLSFNMDTSEPEGGVPEGLSLLDNGAIEGVGDKENKQVGDFFFGISQVVNRHLLLQLNFGLGQDKGYMTDPYKILSVIGESGQTLNYRTEKRPDSRNRNTVMLRSNWHTGRDVLHGSYRFYSDDWGIDAHTIDIKYFWKPDGEALQNWVFRPHFRWSIQSAADFYKHYLMLDESTEYASADSRLSAIRTTTFGLKVLPPEFLSGRFNFKVEYMLQQSDVRLSTIFDEFKKDDVLPDLRAFIFTIGYAIDF